MFSHMSVTHPGASYTPVLLTLPRFLHPRAFLYDTSFVFRRFNLLNASGQS